VSIALETERIPLDESADSALIEKTVEALFLEALAECASITRKIPPAAIFKQLYHLAFLDTPVEWYTSHVDRRRRG
jgi:hypothetical protein